MFLIGQYDSPFVRRVAIALRLYGLPFEQRPWSVFGDAEKIAAYNPLIRVPTLVLDNGDGPGIFGPVIKPVPEGEAAGQLWDRVEWLLRQEGFFELKRGRS